MAAQSRPHLVRCLLDCAQAPAARGRAALRGWGPAAAGEGLLGGSLKQAVPLLAALVNFKATAGLDEGLLQFSLSNTHILYMENPHSYKKCQ